MVVAEPGEFEPEELQEYREPLVADKDGRPGIRQYFMEQAVVVEEPRTPVVTLPEEVPLPEVAPAPIAREPARAAPVPVSPAPASRRRRYLFPAAAGVLLLMVIFLLYLLGRQQVEAGDRRALESVAGEFIVEFTTFNDQTLRQQSEKVKKLIVGDFRETYLELVNDEAYRKYLTDRKGDSKGRVLSLAVSEMSDDQAKVLAFVDVTTVNIDRPNTPEVIGQRLEVILVKTKDGWKVDNVLFL